MNKRILILVVVAFGVFLNMVRPIGVNAVENDTIVENQSGEVDVVTSDNPVKDESLEPKVDDEESTKMNAESPKKNDSEEQNKTESEELTKEELEESTNEENITEPLTNGNSETGEEDDIHGGEIYDIQKVKVITTKVDEEGNMLAGAKLQILDQSGKVLDEWTSTGEAHETLLPDGTYILHETEAPEGYDIAEDKEFTVKVEIAQLDAGSDASATPCPHYTGTQMYYVEIAGKKHEVYCINQNWDTPDDDSIYDGEILNSDSIRDYTKQTVPVALEEDDPTKVIMSDGPIDISDQSLSDEELYDKILDIIYHRHTAVEDLGKQGLTYTTEEIRFITEVALKNYTNAGLTERQYNVKATDALLAAFDAAGVVYKTYVRNGTRYVSYLKHNYRDYVYVPDAPLGQDIVKTDYGKGDSFGQMVAGHWNSYSNTNYLHPDADPSTQAHNAKNNQEDRDTVARFYALFNYLINNDKPHPTDMHLYIYSSSTTPLDPAGNNNDAKYQNLLGVTGYFEDVKQQELEIEMINNYSTETTNVKVIKIWDDADNQDGIRPEKIEVTLSNGQRVILNEENGWMATIENLPVYAKGEKIVYTWTEVNVEGYELTNIETEGYVTTFTNTHTPELISVKVTKVWADDDNESGKRPTSITIVLLANDKEVDRVTLSESDGWNYVFSDLPLYAAGKKIVYTVREENIPEGYVASYEEDGETGFIVHNVLGQGGDEPPDNPQTGDNIFLYLITLLISITGIVTLKLCIKKVNIK